MSDTFTIDMEEMRRLGTERRAIHRNHKSSRELSATYQEVGMAGELAFAAWSDHPMDKTKRPRGDKWDFLINDWRIDVKTTSNDYAVSYLLVELGKIRNDLYVLARYEGDGLVTLLGYTTADEVAEAPYRDFGRGLTNHYLQPHQLRPMRLLRAVLSKSRFGEMPEPEKTGPIVSPFRMREIMLNGGIGTEEQRARWQRELDEMRSNAGLTAEQEVAGADGGKRRGSY
jgi:hypothetical protein